MPRHPSNISRAEYQRLAKHVLLPREAKDHKAVERKALELEADENALRQEAIRKRLRELNGKPRTRVETNGATHAAALATPVESILGPTSRPYKRRKASKRSLIKSRKSPKG